MDGRIIAIVAKMVIQERLASIVIQKRAVVTERLSAMGPVVATKAGTARSVRFVQPGTPVTSVNIAIH
jgi:hypothetical protein